MNTNVEIIVHAPENTKKMYEEIVRSIIMDARFKELYMPKAFLFLIADYQNNNFFDCDWAADIMLVSPIPMSDVQQFGPKPIYTIDQNGDFSVQLPVEIPEDDEKAKPIFEKLHTRSFGNGHLLHKPGIRCGCFYCIDVFDSSKLREEDCATEEPLVDARTVGCPYCGTGSVIYQTEDGIKITDDLMERMHDLYF